jgi:hypothetical protein
MIDITFENGFVTFQSSVCGIVNSQIESLEIVDDSSYHLGTFLGVFLINIEQFSINGNQFNTSIDGIEYLNSL